MRLLSRFRGEFERCAQRHKKRRHATAAAAVANCGAPVGCLFSALVSLDGGACALLALRGARGGACGDAASWGDLRGNGDGHPRRELVLVALDLGAWDTETVREGTPYRSGLHTGVACVWLCFVLFSAAQVTKEVTVVPVFVWFG